MIPKNCTMRVPCICYAPITGYNQCIRSCSTHRPDTMRPGQEKGIDPAVAWPVLLHTLDRPRNGSHQLLAADFDWIGGICYADTLQVWFPAHWAPVVFQQLQHKEDSYRVENPSWMDQEEALADIRKQWQEARVAG